MRGLDHQEEVGKTASYFGRCLAKFQGLVEAQA
jgi:hypothetical protein